MYSAFFEFPLILWIYYTFYAYEIVFTNMLNAMQKGTDNWGQKIMNSYNYLWLQIFKFHTKKIWIVEIEITWKQQKMVFNVSDLWHLLWYVIGCLLI